jgi:hypothetical protein
MHDRAARAVENRAQIVERAAEVQVRDVDVPVLVRPERLHEPSALLRRLRVPTVEQPSAGEHTIDARRACSGDVAIDHHEREPAIAFERKPIVELDDRALLVVEQPAASSRSLLKLEVAVKPTPRGFSGLKTGETAMKKTARKIRPTEATRP